MISDFVLKVCGKEEYIYGDNKLIEYVYIYRSLTQNKTPTLVVVSVHNVPRKLSYEYDERYNVTLTNSLSRHFKRPCLSCCFSVHRDEHLYEVPEEADMSRRNSSSSVTLRKKSRFVSSYNVDDKFSFKICFITNLNVQSAEVR